MNIIQRAINHAHEEGTPFRLGITFGSGLQVVVSVQGGMLIDEFRCPVFINPDQVAQVRLIRS